MQHIHLIPREMLYNILKTNTMTAMQFAESDGAAMD
jgi:hypothetical protein